MPSSGRKSLASANASLLRCAPDWLAAGVPTGPAPAGLAAVSVMGWLRLCARRPGGGARPRGPRWSIATELVGRRDRGRPRRRRRTARARLRHDRSAPADCRPLVPPRGLAHRLRGPRPAGRGRRAVAARRRLRHRARGVVGSSRGARAHGRDAALLARASTSGSSRRDGRRRRPAVRPARDGHAADRRPRARPDPAAARAVRPDRRRHRALGAADGRGASRATAPRSASTRASAR